MFLSSSSLSLKMSGKGGVVSVCVSCVCGRRDSLWDMYYCENCHAQKCRSLTRTLFPDFFHPFFRLSLDFSSSSIPVRFVLSSYPLFRFCILEEIDSYFCSFCLENITTATALKYKNRSSLLSHTHTRTHIHAHAHSRS